MPSPHVFPPTPPDFHPEFGYIWPAAQTRRIVRVGLMSTAFGVLFGAVAVVAMTSRADPDLARVETALSAAPVEEPTSVGAAVSPAPGVASAAPAAIETPPPAAIAPSQPPAPAVAKSCKEQTWPYLEGKCLNNNTARKRQQVRVLKPEAPAQSAPAQVVPAATLEITAAAKPPESPKVSAKKREKTAQTRQSRRDRAFADAERARYADPRAERGRYVDPRSAYAYESRYELPRRGWGW